MVDEALVQYALTDDGVNIAYTVEELGGGTPPPGNPLRFAREQNSRARFGR